ncbi:hypothetical protein MMC30_009197 [Trapelia coarctata]|nr:hypothetical protein [Trapelia coarctata]
MLTTFTPSRAVRAGSWSTPPTPKSPFSLIASDFGFVVKLYRDLPGIFLPLMPSPRQSENLDELYPSYSNLRDIILHAILVLLQAAFILSLPLCLLLTMFVPLTVTCIWFAIFAVVDLLLCRLLNGPSVKQFYIGHPPSGTDIDPTEKWLFINGIATGENWLQNNLDRLANTFRREITGVQNPTKGILFDLIECLIQRDLNYPTADIRAGCLVLKHALESPKIKKAVLLLHSQGGIEGAAIIDHLLAEVAEADLAKLEIYTFASAARHFNNPIRNPLPVPVPVANGDVANGAAVRPSASPELLEKPMRVFRYIEHYANSGDFVAKIGVLQFSQRNAARGTALTPFNGKVFEGRVFERAGATGHLLNQHYLDEMFRMEGGEVAEGNAFMDSLMDPDSVGGGDESGDMESETLEPARMVPIKTLSRLWEYRNGRSPAS